MFCPSCGAQNKVEQKFCRSCGMNLEQSVSSMLEQFPTGARSDIQRQEKMLEKFGNVAFGGFGVVIGLGVLGFIYVILSRMILSGTQPLTGAFFIAFLIFAALSLTYVFWRESLKEKRSKIETAPGRDLDSSPAANRLVDGSEFTSVPSVVEGTTDLLDIKRKTKELK